MILVGMSSGFVGHMRRRGISRWASNARSGGYLLIWLIVWIVFLPGCEDNRSSSNSEIPFEQVGEPIVEMMTDGSYRCRPLGEGLFPGILYNHGGRGGAIGGDLEGVCRGFARIGFIALSQRRPNNVTLDGQFESVLGGFNILRMTPGVDANRIGIIGFSRGALLTLQVAVQLADAVRAIAICAPAWGRGALERTLLHAARIQAPVRVYVAENDNPEMGEMRADHVEISRIVERALRDAGNDVELTIYPAYPGGGHFLFFGVREPWWGDVSYFFNQVLVFGRAS